MSRHKHLCLFATAVCLLSGCVPAVSYRASPGFSEQAQRIRTVALLPSKVKVYQIDAGGVREEMEAWSAQARNNVITALENELRAKLKAAMKNVGEESLAEEKALAEETRALYSAVSAMILLHTYPNPNFPNHFFEEKLKQFDYSLGVEVNRLAKEAEALLLVDAEDHIWTAGRQALQALGVILGIGAGVGTGVVVIPQLGGGTSLRAALVDSRTGDILWMNAVTSGAGRDLRNPESTTEMASQLFKDFPGYESLSREEKPR
ncbi:MAG: hypothetical protein HY695_13955 [Deltaproteobacteria bacterium]|nr:hypothetical protein [Deltaproteobacteria bacterium]